MSLMGASGLDEVNQIGCAGAHQLADELVKTGKVKLKYPEYPFLNEFVLTTDFDVDDFLAKGVDCGVLGGVKRCSRAMT